MATAQKSRSTTQRQAAPGADGVPTSPEIKEARSRLAALQRWREDSDPEVVAAQSKLKSLVLDQHVRRIVGEFPPLSFEARASIAAVLLSEDAAQGAQK